jgi:branched-chain amino acid transport system permease protein
MTTTLDRPTRIDRRTAPVAGVTIASAAGTLLVAAAVPAVAGPYPVTVAAVALVLAMLAMSTQLLVGVAGLPAFGQPAYAAIGAYTAALLGNAGQQNAVVQLAAATAAAAVAAAVTAPLLLRVRDTAFLMATFALQQLITTAASQWQPVTGGDEGLHATPIVLWPGTAPVTAPAYLYWYVLAVFAVAGVLIALLLRSRLVLALRGIADHEPRMIALGHRATATLTGGYTAAGALAGAAGALLVAVNQYISPADFGFEIASLMLLAAAIGAGTLTGAAAAAVLIVAVRDLLGTAHSGTAPLLLGVLFIAVVYLPVARRAITGRRAGSSR